MDCSLLMMLIIVPLFGAVISAVFGSRLGLRLTGAIASAAVLTAFGIGLFLFWKLVQVSPEGRFLTQHLFGWIESEHIDIGFDFYLDALSSCMVLVITGVGLLIHIYSIGYMAHEPGFRRYFALLNLFVAAMLMLVLGRNLAVTFIGWEGVGFCSYALIGFWFSDEAKAIAGKKAFIVNRIGDLGFLLGTFLIAATFHTLDFPALAGLLRGEGGLSLTDSKLTIVGNAIMFLLMAGAAGKSAQIPLYVWLPDAMAGPTPVSALIHAATMVTAGVYLVARMEFLQPFSGMAYMAIAVIGAITALFAATIALAQRDIKRILAYSTISQLGYMFLACGIGATAAGIFHLVTHACFKALLFLGAGAVIHALHDEQDVLEMGGLRGSLPLTTIAMAVAVLAISGIPPFAGFVSKDEILFATFASGNYLLYSVAVLTALLTAFYMGRLFFYTFFGEPRGKAAGLAGSIHDCPPTMAFALIVLAVLSAGVGILGWPEALGGHNYFAEFLGGHAQSGGGHERLAIELAGLSTLVGVLGLLAAFVWTVGFAPAGRLKILEPVEIVWSVIWNKYYVDEIYSLIVIRPLRFASELCYTIGDVKGIDGLVNGIGSFVNQAGQLGRQLQNGVVQLYGLVLIIGSLILVVYLMVGL